MTTYMHLIFWKSTVKCVIHCLRQFEIDQHGFISSMADIMLRLLTMHLC